MVRFDDVYKIRFNLINRNYDEKSINEQKEIIEEELIKYLLRKINELDSSCVLPNDNNLIDIMSLIEKRLSKEEVGSFSHVIFFILNIASCMQGRTIIWWCEDGEKLKDNPEISFDDDGYWDKVTTHKDTNMIQIFNFVYDIFKNNYMIKEKEQMRLVHKES